MDILKDNLPLVVIFGRANVGKSTLFNRLTGRKQALTANTSETTRDANCGEAEWQGVKLRLVDTGGIVDERYLAGNKSGPKPGNAEIGGKVQVQTRAWLDKADLVLFVADAKDGLLPTDKKLALALKKIIGKSIPILLAANKADNPRLRQNAAEFARLGLGEPLPVSAANGSGLGDLLDLTVENLPDRPRNTAGTDAGDNPEAAEAKPINVAIIGQPNAGKSSLLNALCGKEASITSPLPHTTREPKDLLVEHEGRLINFIDTAGLSRQGQKGARQKKLKNTLEKLSIQKSLSALKRADVALLVIDISANLSRQDAKLTEEALSRQVSLIIAANKWDLVKDRDQKRYAKAVHSRLPFAVWAPIHFLSALTGAKADKLYGLIIAAQDGRQTVVSENALSKFLSKLVKVHTPTKGKGANRPHIYELKQADTSPPVFSIRIGAKEHISESYLNFMANRLRKKFGFTATPIKIFVEKNRPVHGRHPETTKKPG